MAEKVEIKVTVDKQTGEIKVAGQEVKDLGSKIDTAGQKAKTGASSFDELTGALGNVLAAGAVIQFFRSATDAAIAQENAIERLNAAMRINGDFSQQASKDLQEFATQLQGTSIVGDEVILNQLALAKSFGASNESAKLMTEAALNFSVTAGISFEESLRRIGRAAGGSVEDLAKFVPAVKDLTKAQLANGEAARVVQERFKGAAAAQAETFGGALIQTRNLLGDVTEEIGGALFPALGNFNEKLRSSLPFIQNFGLVIAGVVGTAITGIKSVIDILSTAVSTAVELVIESVTIQKQVISGVVQAIVAILRGRFSEAKEIIGNVATEVAESAARARDAALEGGREIVEGSRKNGEALEETWRGTFGRVAGIEQEAAADSKDTNDKSTQAKIDNARKISAEEKKLALEVIELERGKFEALRVRLEQEIEALREKGIEQIIIEEEGAQRTISLEEIKQLKLKQIRDAEEKDRQTLLKKQQEDDKKEIKRKISLATENTKVITDNLSTVLSATTTSSAKQEEIAKAVSIANALRSTFEGANKAIAQGGFFGIATAGIVIAAGLANVAKIQAFQEGGRVTRPTVGLVGEGNEGESIVPDSKAAGFALGFLAARGARGFGGVGQTTGKISVVFEGGINITIESVDLNDPTVRRDIVQTIAEELQEETEEAITMARRTVDLNEINAQRTV